MFQFFGGELEAEQVVLAAPAPGSRSSIQIRTRVGIGVDLRVTDDEGHSLPGVNVATQWTRDDVWNRVDRRTNSEGRARLSQLPTGEVWVRLRKPGYVPELRQLVRAEEWVRHSLDVKMGRAAIVEGQCRSNGRALPKFTVYFWMKSAEDGGKIDVDESEDGSFRVEEAAPGLVQLIASSPEVAQSAPVSLTVDAGAVGKAVIEMPAPRVAYGQVIDAVSGAPVPSVRVWVRLLFGGAVEKPWKTAFLTNEQGFFEIAGLGKGVGLLDVAAEGYATRSASVPAGDEPRIELGRIALHRTQNLVVRLRSSTPVDYASYDLYLFSESRNLPGLRFSSDGTVVINDLAPGPAQLLLAAKDSSTEQVDVRIRPGGTNTCYFDLDGAAADIDVVPQSGSELPDQATLGLEFIDHQGSQRIRVCDIPRSGHVHVDKLDADWVLLEVLTENGARCLASGEFALPTKDPRRITFEMRAKPARMRIVDVGHHPIVGASVTLSSSRNAIRWLSGEKSDELGEVYFPDIGPGVVSVSVFHGEYGAQPCAQLTLQEASAGTVDITLAPGAETEIFLRDGGEGLAGVEMELKDSCGSSMTTGRLLAGTDGRVHFAHLAPGDYRVLVDHPGIWRSEQSITVGATPASLTVQLRRLGSARIRAKSGAGNPIEGASVELVDVATGASVADWIEQGEVPPTANGLRTDSSGTLLIHGIPRGSYRCVVTTASGAVLERTLEVPPQATGELEAVLQ